MKKPSFACEICSKRFAYKNSLKKHKLIHLVEKSREAVLGNTKQKNRLYPSDRLGEIALQYKIQYDRELSLSKKNCITV